MASQEYLEKARSAATAIGLNFDDTPYTMKDLAVGIKVEEEHGSISPKTNVTDDDNAKTAKIALAHLNEFPDYYTRLHYVEHASPLFWSLAPMLTNVAVIIILFVIIAVLAFRIGRPKPMSPMEYVRARKRAFAKHQR